ncbi:MAG: hypothetical protein R6U32_06805 [Candidatus Woesearchaeota archaeon]
MMRKTKIKTDISLYEMLSELGLIIEHLRYDFLNLNNDLHEIFSREVREFSEKTCSSFPQALYSPEKGQNL